MGLLEVLTLILIVLKLVGVIGIAWWQVFIPMYIAAVLYGIIITIQIRIWKRLDREMAEHRRGFFK